MTVDLVPVAVIVKLAPPVAIDLIILSATLIA